MQALLQKKVCFFWWPLGYTTRMTTNTGDYMEHIKQALADRNLSVVAKETGLNPHTLYRLTSDKKERQHKPHQATIAVLTKYLFPEKTH